MKPRIVSITQDPDGFHVVIDCCYHSIEELSQDVIKKFTTKEAQEEQSFEELKAGDLWYTDRGYFVRILHRGLAVCLETENRATRVKINKDGQVFGFSTDQNFGQLTNRRRGSEETVIGTEPPVRWPIYD